MKFKIMYICNFLYIVFLLDVYVFLEVYVYVVLSCEWINSKIYKSVIDYKWMRNKID